MITYLPASASPTILVKVLDAIAISIQSSRFKFLAPVASLLSSILFHRLILSHVLSLSFNGWQFYYLSNVFLHICNYPEGQDHVILYINVVRQTTQIFDMDAVFTLGLINAIKKDKSFEIELWIKHQVDLFVAFIKCYVKAARVGKSQCKEALKIINRCWGSEITDFFHSCNESEKIFYQLGHLLNNSFLYYEAWYGQSYCNREIANQFIIALALIWPNNYWLKWPIHYITFLVRICKRG